MANVVRVEVLRDETSDDVRALVEAARLRKEHASATYAVRLGRAEIGTLESTVTGGQGSDQLLYHVTAHVSKPFELSLKGFVFATWDRRLERLLVEATWAGERHRLDAEVLPGESMGKAVLRGRHAPPAPGAPRHFEWVIGEPPVLAPGPLPLPRMDRERGGISSRGQVVDPLSGSPVEWRLESSEPRRLEAGGRVHDAVSHVLSASGQDVSLWVDRTGLPLRVELPLGIEIVLEDEVRHGWRAGAGATR